MTARLPCITFIIQVRRKSITANRKTPRQGNLLYIAPFQASLKYSSIPLITFGHKVWYGEGKTLVFFQDTLLIKIKPSALKE